MKKMSRLTVVATSLATIVALGSIEPARAGKKRATGEHPVQLVITKAVADLDASELEIFGDHFGASPTVLLGDEAGQFSFPHPFGLPGAPTGWTTSLGDVPDQMIINVVAVCADLP